MTVTSRRLLSRPRLLAHLDAAQTARLVMLRAPGGSGKTVLISDWLAHRPTERAAWVALDESTKTRQGFWHRVAQALLRADVVRADGPLFDFVSGFVGVGHVPGLLLDELAHADRPTRVVLDDFHLADSGSADDIVWLLDRSDRLRVAITTRTRGRLEDPDVVARLESTVITGAELAFDIDEILELGRRSEVELDATTARIIEDATAGHPLSTRVALATFDTVGPSTQADVIDRPTLVHRITAHATRDLLSGFGDAGQRDTALRLAVAPAVDPRLAEALSGDPEVARVLERFQHDGFGGFRVIDGEDVFSFHALIRGALELEAETSLEPGELERLRRIAAEHLATHGDPLNALRLQVKLGDYGRMWPVVASNFSDLIVHHQSELEEIIAGIPRERLRTEGTIAIVLAIIRSEQQANPSADVRQLVGRALEQLAPERTQPDPLDRFWVLISIFAGLRAARRYGEAAGAADVVVAHVNGMPADARDTAGSAIGAVYIQIVITFILIGRFHDAVQLLGQLSHDHHAGRLQHRLSLLAYIQALRGEIGESDALLRDVTYARHETWLAGVQATGWYLARAFLRLERNDPRGAVEEVAALDSRLPVLEQWPYILWVKGLGHLAGNHPELGVDELTLAMRRNHDRAAGAVPRDLLVSLQSDLYLAAGQPGRARRALQGRDPDSSPIALSRARLHLAEGRLDDAGSVIAPLLWGDGATLRHQAEAQLLQSVIDVRLGLIGEAAITARRAYTLLQRHGLRLPLIMVPRFDLETLTRAQLPEFLPMLDGLADPFGRLGPHMLSPREQVVLAELASTAHLEAIAARLFVSVNTVKTQLRNIYRKLGVSSRDEAVRVAKRRGLLPD